MPKWSSILNQNKNQKSFASKCIQENKSPFFKPVIQPKLTVGAFNDQYEQEADAIADKVMRMTANQTEKTFFQPKPLIIKSLQRKCVECEKEEKLQRKDDEKGKEESLAGIALQRKCEECEEEEKNVNRKESANAISPNATPVVEQTLNSSGQRMDQSTRSFMEERFGYDFSNVQIHNDSLAHQSSADLNALAYTHGNNIVFREGEYQPETDIGKRLLAHELTHVVQKAHGRDKRDTLRCAAVISAARFSPKNAPTTSFAVVPSFIPKKWTIDMTTDTPGFTLDSAVNVSCGSGTAAGYEVGIVQVETIEFSEATYFGLSPADGSIVARKSQLRKPAGPCIDSRTGAFWTADAFGEKSLKPPACGTNVALPPFSDLPSESYPGWIENGLTHKPNYISEVQMKMEFVDALAAKMPSGNVNILKWLRWGVNWAGKFNSNASGSTPAGIIMGGGFWLFGNDGVRPPEIPATYAVPSKTCTEISQDAINSGYVVETNASYSAP